MRSRLGIEPKIKTTLETLDMLVDTENSLARYGDGEFSLMMGMGIPFQDYDANLAKRLREIVKLPPARVEVAIGRAFWCLKDKKVDLDNCSLRFAGRYGKQLDKMIDYKRQYWNTGVSQFYHGDFNIIVVGEMFEKAKLIWDKKDILLVCGERTFSRLDYNVFDNAKSIDYIYGPSKNAWSNYSDLLKKTKERALGRLVLIILGPTATVMAADLAT